MDDSMSQSERPSDPTYQDRKDNSEEEPRAVAGTSVQSAAYLAFLPPADELAKYQKLYPEITEALFEMAKAEREHRHQCDLKRLQLEEKKIDNENNHLQMSAGIGNAAVKVTARGQRAAVVIQLTLIVAFCVCAIGKAHWATGGLFVLLCAFSYLIYSSPKSYLRNLDPLSENKDE